LIAYLHLWLKFWEGIDKYWIVPVRKLFYFHHWLWRKFPQEFQRTRAKLSKVSGEGQEFINNWPCSDVTTTLQNTAIVSERPQFFFKINESW